MTMKMFQIFFFRLFHFIFDRLDVMFIFFTFLRWSMMIHVSSGPFSLRFSLLLLFVVHFQITKLEQWSISISVCLFLLCKFNARFDCCLLLFVCCCCLILPYPKKKLLNNNNKNESFFTKKKIVSLFLFVFWAIVCPVFYFDLTDTIMMTIVVNRIFVRFDHFFWLLSFWLFFEKK